MTMDLRFVLYQPNTSTVVATVERPREARVPFEDSTRTVLQWRQPTGAAWLEDPVEVQPQLRTTGQWVDAGGRYDLVEVDGDLLAQDASVTVTASSMWGRLAGAVVYMDPAQQATRDLGEPAQLSPRKFTGTTARNIMSTLVAEEKARGRLVGITVGGTGSLPSVAEVEFGHGSTLEAALSALCDRGYCRARWVGKVLHILPPTPAATTPVVLTVGRDLTDAPVKISREGQATVALVQGDQGVTVEVTSAGPAPYGPSVLPVTAAGTTDPAELQRIGTEELAAQGRTRTQRQAGLYLQDPGSPKPILGYQIGDQVALRTGARVDVGALVQVVFQTDRLGELSAAITVGDRMPDYGTRRAQADRQARRGMDPAGLGQQKWPADYLSPDFDASSIPWNDAWGLMGECSPTCSCRTEIYPRLVASGSYMTGPAISSATTLADSIRSNVPVITKPGHRYVIQITPPKLVGVWNEEDFAEGAGLTCRVGVNFAYAHDFDQFGAPLPSLGNAPYVEQLARWRNVWDSPSVYNGNSVNLLPEFVQSPTSLPHLWARRVVLRLQTTIIGPTFQLADGGRIDVLDMGPTS